MIYIAHRGLFQGPSKELENHPGQIALAIEQGYNVEIDIRYIDGKLVLGHDHPEYEVDEYWLRNDKLWIHCKNLEALDCLKEFANVFYHSGDDYTLTSEGYIWTFPGMPVTEQCEIVQNECEHITEKIHGICSDNIEWYRKYLDDLHE